MIRPHWRSVAAIGMLALAIRLVLLFARGDYLVYDEGYYLLLARSLRAGNGFTLNGLPHVALSPLQPLIAAGLSFTGLPDLWASRLLAALCGALLVVPVATIAGRWFGPRGAASAALFVAVHPALLSFLPFFPGQTWNLYFGSEPLYLMLAAGAVAAGIRAATDELWRWWLAAGVLGALAWLARLEGVVLSAALGLAMLGTLAWRRRLLALWPRAALALLAGGVIAAPYLVYLHSALGRWALSGRVQAAVSEAAPAAAPVPAPVGATGSDGSSAVRNFVWGGDTETLWRTLYALDGTGTRMASQYWGVPRAGAGVGDPTPPATIGPPGPAAAAPGPAPTATDTTAAPDVPGTWSTLVRAIRVVVPAWLLVLAVYGFTRAWTLPDAATWIAPMLVAALLPALLAYAEPRALLLLAPATCILAAGATEQAWTWAEARWPGGRRGAAAPGLVALLLVAPTARDLARAWNQQTPLQQLSSARRVVGEYLGEHLPADARIVSWHPAIAVWARRDWRVLPYAPLDRIVGYARAQRAGTVVFSRFEPSPLRDPPRAFTAILLDSTSVAAGARVRLDLVDQTPALFVGRLALDSARQ